MAVDAGKTCPPGSYRYSLRVFMVAAPLHASFGDVTALPIQDSSLSLLLLLPAGVVVASCSLDAAPECTLCPGGRYGVVYGLMTANCSGPCVPGYYCPPGAASPCPPSSCLAVPSLLPYHTLPCHSTLHFSIPNRSIKSQSSTTCVQEAS